MELTRDEALLALQWFESRLDQDKKSLLQKDFVMARKLYIFCELNPPILIVDIAANGL